MVGTTPWVGKYMFDNKTPFLYLPRMIDFGCEIFFTDNNDIFTSDIEPIHIFLGRTECPVDMGVSRTSPMMSRTMFDVRPLF